MFRLASVALIVFLLSTTSASIGQESELAEKQLFRVVAIQGIPEHVIVATDEVMQILKDEKRIGQVNVDNYLGVISEVASEIPAEIALEVSKPLRYEYWLGPPAQDGSEQSPMILGALPITEENARKMFSADDSMELEVVAGESKMYRMLNTVKTRKAKTKEFETRKVLAGFLHFNETHIFLLQFMDSSPRGIDAETARVAFKTLAKDIKRSSKYQWSISSAPNTINPPMRDAILQRLRQSVSSALQQRDGEDDAGYQLRRLGGLTALSMLTRFFKDCEQIEVGFIVDPARKRGTVDLAMRAKDGSPMDRWFTKAMRVRSPFSDLLKSDTSNKLALSLNLGEDQIDALSQLVPTVISQLEESGIVKTSGKAFAKAFKKEIQRGQVHFLTQAENNTESSVQDGLSGGIAVKCGGTLAPFLDEVMQFVERMTSGVKRGQPTDGRAAVHILQNPNSKVHLAVCGNSQGLWFAQAMSEDEARAIMDGLLLDLELAKGGQATLVAANIDSNAIKMVFDLMDRAIDIGGSFSENLQSSRAAVSEEVYAAAEYEQLNIQTESAAPPAASAPVASVPAEAVAAASPAQANAVAIAKAKPRKNNRPKFDGRVRVSTLAAKNGIRIRGEFQKDAIVHLMLVPDLVLELLEEIID